MVICIKKDVQYNLKYEDIEIMKILYTELNINISTKLGISALYRHHEIKEIHICIYNYITYI